MKQTEQPLYPKLSSIYNKILQLTSAILLIIVLISILHSTGVKNSHNLTEHFTFIAKQQLQQAIAGVTVILELEHKDNIEKKIILQRYLDGLAKVNFIKQAHLYDATGLLLVSSTSVGIDKQGDEIARPKAKSINDLYGISPHQRNLTDKLTPFIEEISYSDPTSQELHGYLRFTIEQSYLMDILAKADEEQQSLHRLMLLLAGVVGFLLTRGLNRFSRRGYRLNSSSQKAGS
ncbi:hypothetical protein [Colwellia psychrerythraea]|uniref:Virulence factor, hemolysin regulator n=1 Tax=Colwellia psychrerythraea TaxID=28229 RepID=A0A099KIT6_COLPS|nr:hypothetical protein [Colwellia psychrerythraea]KGJ89508.1 Virulence factor, hemolysin regulator [Colwellia psychrerythraea]